MRSYVHSSNYDIIFITETWLTVNTHTSNFAIAGYKAFSVPRLNNRGGGSLIYCRESLPVTRMHDPILEAVEDSVWLTVKLQSQELLLGCIYHIPNSLASNFIPLINAFNFIKDLPIAHKVIAGDFNAPGVCWSSLTCPRQYRDFVACISMGGWSQQVKNPTRGNNILDLLFTQGLGNVITSVKQSIHGCDHRAIVSQFDLPKIIITSTASIRPYHKSHWYRLPDLIRSGNWDESFLSNDPQAAANQLYDNLCKAVDIITPAQLNLVKPRSNRLSRLKNKLVKLQSAATQSRDLSSYIQIDILSRNIRSYENELQIQQESKALNNPKQKTEILSKLMKFRNTQPKQIIPFLNFNNSNVHKPEDMAELFNTYFASSLTADVPKPASDQVCHLNSSLTTVTFHPDEISLELSHLRLSYRPGPDGIPPAAFCLGGPDIPLLLSNVFNLSLKCSIFPTQWKTSIIIPLHKKGSIHEPENYRPVNHTPIVSRIMERIIKKTMITHLMQNKLLNMGQHGFLQNRSCATCQTDFLNTVTVAADRGMAVIVVLLDMQKAFDRVSHSRLITQAERYGIANPLLNWLKSYLSRRFQTVSVNGASSQPKPVTSGVIQGSVLGPLLFLLYINDVFNVVQYGKLFLFADDIKIVYTFDPTGLSAMIPNISQDLAALSSWCDITLMKFSAEKSNILTFKCNIPTGTFNIDGHNIPNNPLVRDLGLQYSCSFSFTEHNASQISKARRMIGLINRSFVLQGSKLSIYLTHVRPMLEYCSIIYSNMPQYDRVAIEKVQRHLTKELIGFSSPLNYKQRCEYFKIDPLWLRRMKLNLSFFHRLITNKVVQDVPQVRNLSESRYPLRSISNSVIIPSSKIALRSNFFLVKYAALWNKLPQNIRSIRSITLFKHCIREHLTVRNLIGLINPYISEERAYEQGVGF